MTRTIAAALCGLLLAACTTDGEGPFLTNVVKINEAQRAAR